ncbi:uracil glycosylase [Cavenderia fasciculata]|uniref:Uracil-DNA glycosylase n=1 Tax=Cavenderia fasciculata TaxID=261658 RepID=F4PM28_CACFS|nr:uracil glycosylase [Cavenderia fasciculata]EGG22731.1 uracil glycosylase [Cavenderia fasciculata]|eukprot:XP_004360582.1 uracil glycosylase [Cavenderia fasciculata]
MESSSYLTLSNHMNDQSWRDALQDEFEKPHFKQLQQTLNKMVTDDGETVFPSIGNTFTAFNLTPLDRVRVVIIGQDPYFNENQAHGLSFSVLHPTPPPPSLKNIYKELISDLGQDKFQIPNHGNLEVWAQQGVLMLNAVLTVTSGKANSHAKVVGWEKFTDRVLEILNARVGQPIVFVLWGQYAIKKAKGIDKNKHHVIESGHPSPLSVKHFLGSKPFSKTNQFLQADGSTEINWSL